MPKRKLIQAPSNECTRNTEHVIIKTHKTGGADGETGGKQYPRCSIAAAAILSA